MTTTAAGVTLVREPEAGDQLRVMGDRITFKLRAQETGGAFTLFEGVVGPGRGEPIHYHEREDETFTVLAGRAAFLHGDTWTEVGPGTVVYIPRGVTHSFRNAGSVDLRLLVLNTPGGLHEELFAAMSQVSPPATPEEGAALAALMARYHTILLPPSAG